MRLSARTLSPRRFGRFCWPATRPAVVGIALGAFELWRYARLAEVARWTERGLAQRFAADILAGGQRHRIGR